LLIDVALAVSNTPNAIRQAVRGEPIRKGVKQEVYDRLYGHLKSKVGFQIASDATIRQWYWRGKTSEQAVEAFIKIASGQEKVTVPASDEELKIVTEMVNDIWRSARSAPSPRRQRLCMRLRRVTRKYWDLMVPPEKRMYVDPEEKLSEARRMDRSDGERTRW
jgi:hypothetical protein